MSDLIDRQAAIDEIEYELEMINSALDSLTLDFIARERLQQRRGEAREILNSIQQLPSAQPEPLTDKEQRIFLAAMEREEKICKEIDEEWQEAYEESLVEVCREIERKVKKALWTN